MPGRLHFLWIVCLFGSFWRSSYADPNRVPCYDQAGRAQRCFSPFVNAAFNLSVEATNTCGMRGPEDFCQQTGISGATKSCDVCDNSRPEKSHPPSYLTDFHSVESLSWWQSSTMLENVQWPNSVNLTLHLGKAFEITYVRLKFHSSRPESFAIYKRTNEQGPWISYQFYSASCQKTYNLDIASIILRHNEAQAICRDDFSDISPLTDGSVAFSTLEGRPSAYDFENSPSIQEWVTATDIRIVLNRINTFGDEVFGDPIVLRSYFYAITDFSVGGRCKCNGHASECQRKTGQRLEDRLVCRCEHNTTGPDCGECLPFYNDRPWRRATATDAFECQPCNCNGLSSRCHFDEELYRRTGHGGHCDDCRENTFGPNCDRCRDNYFRRSNAERCQACNCHPIGSRQMQCEVNGQCQCKPGVSGDKCDRCQSNYFDFGVTGCRQCQCSVAGSLNNRPDCVPETGKCKCKENVEGQNCDTCKSGFFGLSEDDPQGCMACFCYGHSSSCTSSPGYTTRVVHSDFESGVQRWRGETRGGRDVALEFNNIAGHIGVSAESSEPVYFLAPDRYLGDHRHSYNLLLTFNLRVGEEGAKASVSDVILEGSGLTFSAPIFAQGNPLPRTVKADYKFRLNEHSSYQWTPRLTPKEFIRLLSNITAIKIRGTYSNQGVGFLDNVKLQSAREGGGGSAATNVEQCTCPEGYVGQFCESCAPGYRREPLGGGPYAKCIPCNCNKHSDTCEATTGRCICQHNTAGLNCERCAPGYYGYALAGTSNDCKLCPCPDHGQCVELLNGQVACTDCREGYTGHRCDLCEVGYFGDPDGKYGPRRACQRCSCNENVDMNAVGNCNSTTGECLKCIYNTAGFYCEKCLSNYFGNALALPKGLCRACNCYSPGSVRGHHGSECDQGTGQCLCRSNVVGERCDQCLDSYWNIDSSSGCERCNCDRTGSLNASCEIKTGQCYCKPGVAGKRCDRCIENYYGFSPQGCKACSCNPDGSRSLQCDILTGDCVCRPNIEGRNCDRCEENKYNITASCIDCPVCYNLVQQHVNILRRKINELRLIIENINKNPTAINDTDFRRKLVEINDQVNRLWQDAKQYTGSDGSLSDQLVAIHSAINDLTSTLTTITTNIEHSSDVSQKAARDTTAAERAIDDAERALRAAERHLETEGQKALERAKEAQKRLGQQSERMTRIANEARQEAELQETNAMRIEKTAKDALNTSEEALRTAQNAIQKPVYVEEEINKIKREVFDASRLYNQTKALAEESRQKAEDVYRESLSLYTDVDSIRIAPVDVSSLKTEINQVKDEAGQIKEEANDLIVQHQSLMADVEKQKEEASRLLEGGERQQQIADELLADADAARDMARKAVAKAERILREANDALKTLREFDRTVKENENEAKEALKKIPIIRKHINDAEQKTQEARDNLDDAEQNAILAKEIAERAQDIAEKIYLEITLIRNDTLVTRRRVVTVKEESDRLLVEVDDVERRLVALEKQAEEDAALAKEALEKADLAKSGATAAARAVTGAVSTVDDILRQLATLDKIDIRKLDDLEGKLNEAEQILLDANIDVRFKELEELNVQMQYWLNDYNGQLIQLTQDVSNIRDINATIPRGCFKKIQLEPTEKPDVRYI